MYFLIRYDAGDHVAVFPINDPSLVEKLCKLVGEDPDKVISLLNLDEDSTKKVPFPCPCSYKTALMHYVDIQSVPRTHVLKEIAEYASDPKVIIQITIMLLFLFIIFFFLFKPWLLHPPFYRIKRSFSYYPDYYHAYFLSIFSFFLFKPWLLTFSFLQDKERLQLLSSTSEEGKAEYQKWVVHDARNIIQILEDLPSCKPPLDHLCELLPRLQARYYSISSTPKVIMKFISVFRSRPHFL